MPVYRSVFMCIYNINSIKWNNQFFANNSHLV